MANLENTASNFTARICYSEMLEGDLNNVVDIAMNSLKIQEKSERPVYHKDLALFIKQQVESSKGGTWHVVVGNSFGSFISHETKNIAHFFLGSTAFLIWRHG
mmetsp:Transcript_23948/g.26215  ORF Transcript_23948/g.26215 Transcript_23948/m.26215 type:complete len:103 (-) Transcript_23948:127-435(-)